jgi:hypothetical protein
MNDVYILATITSIVYSIFYYIDTRFITKGKIVLKTLLKNIVLVFTSFVISYYIFKQVGPMKIDTVPVVFTTDPQF